MSADNVYQTTIDDLLKKNARHQATIDKLKGVIQQQAATERRVLRMLDKKDKQQSPSGKAQPLPKSINAKLAGMNAKLDALGEAIQDIHGNTTPEVPWIPSVIVALLLIYPVQEIITDTAKDYKISAWLSGLLIDAQQATSSWALKWGIEATGGTTEYVSPLSGKLIVTSSFDPARKHPVTGLVRPHNGTDYRCSVGTPVYAMQSGIVIHAEMTGYAGNMIAIQHSNGEKSVFMHLDSMSVSKLEKVSTGQKIGTCGATGRVTGSHLHVEVIKANSQYIDPVTVIGIANSSNMWEYFKDTVASSESAGSGDYSAISRSGTFLGRYQMDLPTIAFAGYQNVTKGQFLASPAMQDRVYKSWQAKNLQIARNGFHAVVNGVRVDVNGFMTDSTPAYKVAGFLHAAQFGPINAVRWYSDGMDFKDGNGVKISHYAELGEKAFLAKYGRFASAKPLFDAVDGNYTTQQQQTANPSSNAHAKTHDEEQAGDVRLVVDVSEQVIRVFSGNNIVHTYPVSTAINGVGSKSGSDRTPLGKHRIAQKIGEGAALGAVFKSRENTGRIANILTKPGEESHEDNVTTRILWLDGLEPGENHGGNVDSMSRAIYIHGTDEEGKIGRPASHGCIRMRNRDIVELYGMVSVDTNVDIIM